MQGDLAAPIGPDSNPPAADAKAPVLRPGPIEALSRQHVLSGKVDDLGFGHRQAERAHQFKTKMLVLYTVGQIDAVGRRPICGLRTVGRGGAMRDDLNEFLQRDDPRRRWRS
jgi:hypothetical protein